MSHSQQMVEALDRQELEEAEVQFQQALVEDSEANYWIWVNILKVSVLPSGKRGLRTDCRNLSEVYLSLATILAEEGQMEEAFVI